MVLPDSLDINCILADRIQLSASVPYITISDEEGKDSESFVQSAFNAYLEDKKKHNVMYDRQKRQYYIRVPQDFYSDKYPFISNVRLRLNNPFTVTFEFNFNRLIRSFACSYKEYNKDYDLSIRIADDNYINKQIWFDWDNYLVKNLSKHIMTIALKFASYIMDMYVPDNDLDYRVLTIKQIEFSKDYFVGHHKSSDVLHDLIYFLISSSGTEWINGLSGYAVSFYSAENDNTEGLVFYGDLYNPTVKFFVGKGVYFKVYRKTTDHIRLELTYMTDYINKQKKYIEKPKDEYGNDLRYYGFLPIYDYLRKMAKEFHKKTNFKDILTRSIDNTYSDYFSVTDNLYKFMDNTYPELASIADSASHLNPITDSDLIQFIRSNNRLRGVFSTSLNSHGRKQLIYSPEHKTIKRKTRVKPPYRTKNAPKPKDPKPILMLPQPKRVIWINDKMYVEEWSFAAPPTTNKPKTLNPPVQ